MGFGPATVIPYADQRRLHSPGMVYAGCFLYYADQQRKRLSRPTYGVGTGYLKILKKAPALKKTIRRDFKEEHQCVSCNKARKEGRQAKKGNDSSDRERAKKYHFCPSKTNM
ncbi:hypothetical protein L1987_60342 [Smallanthus sonchifolius]|uniref:Uncharacterized protein n=1 Tax=Smallanthus sonchifolius TaxID=185202 RepID=A0ACB9D7Y4_9ASTR|nr:hypothetical protein L1987_60342 [Smallanthus sonchifolius]